MQISLAGRSALITGGSKGLGFAMAKAFAAAGAEVAIVARGQEALTAAAQAIAAAVPGAKLCVISADVRREQDCAHAAAAAERAFGKVDILINNAGTSQRGPFLAVTDALWQDDLDLKLFAAIRLCRLLLPGMRARRFGRIINVLNIGAKAPRAESMPTSVTRAAGLALTKALANEFARDNVLVNALLVGIIESDQWRRRYAADPRGLSWEEWQAEQGQAVPLGRIGRPEELAAVALLLASEAAGYVTGAAINVDGGASPVV